MFSQIVDASRIPTSPFRCHSLVAPRSGSRSPAPAGWVGETTPEAQHPQGGIKNSRSPAPTGWNTKTPHFVARASLPPDRDPKPMTVTVVMVVIVVIVCYHYSSLTVTRWVMSFGIVVVSSWVRVGGGCCWRLRAAGSAMYVEPKSMQFESPIVGCLSPGVGSPSSCPQAP